MKKTITAISLALALVSCDSFLDKMPDNRAEITTEAQVQTLLTSAYPDNDFMLVTEFLSDNIDDMGPTNPYYDRFIEQVVYWQDITESDNESPERIWESCYAAAAAANEALMDIEKMGGPVTDGLKAAKAEALLCRAYAHFVLVNVFCHAYSEQTSSTDLGIPYSTEPETTLDPKYERGTVAGVYKQIDADIQEALPLQADSYFTVPKYHFNKRAAYAFAARFYLYWQKWDKAEEYAGKCLGTSPETMLRDWEYMTTMTQEYSALVNHFIDASLNCNLLLMTAYSKMGLAFGPYYLYSRFTHNNFLASTEGGLAAQVWKDAEFFQGMKVYSATNLDKTIFWKLPYLFEYTDAVAGIGYYRTVYPAFWCDETLLVRAEARIHQDKYDEAAADLTLWMQNILDTDLELDPAYIRRFYNGSSYYTWDKPSIKKQLNAPFDVGTESSIKESMLQCVLGFRRIETLGQGLRWFDIKRYGIELDRRVMGTDGKPSYVADRLLKDDPRRAVQIPQKATDAGMASNPR